MKLMKPLDIAHVRYATYKARDFEGNDVEYTIRCLDCDSDWLKKGSKYANDIQRMIQALWPQFSILRQKRPI